ncbi:MAG: DUF120 domain-containing protein [Desulfurococcaceae archaeon]
MITIEGRVISGVGEGAYYVEKYSRLLEKVLGEPPYPGTLNVELNTCFYDLVKEIGVPPLVIRPDQEGLGVVYVYTGKVNGVKVLVLKPAITRHKCEIVELVSSKHLRRELELRDGDVVKITIEVLTRS